jgi:vacuolar-type H+-ATPase subunit H
MKSFFFGFLAGISATYFVAYHRYTGELWQEMLAHQAVKAIPFLFFFLVVTVLFLIFHSAKHVLDNAFMEGQAVMSKQIKEAESAISKALHTSEYYHDEVLKQTEQERRQILHQAKTEAERIHRETIQEPDPTAPLTCTVRSDKLAGARGKARRLEAKIEKLGNRI